MKFLILVICVFALTNAIRVPSRWQNGPQNRKQLVNSRDDKYFHKLHPHKFHKLSVLPHKGKPNKQKLRRKLVNSKQPVRFQNFYRTPQNQFAEFSNPMNIWMPVAPFSVNKNLGYPLPKPNWSIDLTQQPQEHSNPSPSEYVTNAYSPLYKNYRDDKTFEKEDDRDEYLTDSIPEIESVSDVAVKSYNEKPSDIPTRPIYPGEKNWADPGQKHKPFISKHEYSDEKETQEERPEGYEIFEGGEELLDKKRAEFENISRNQPKKENLGSNFQTSGEEVEEDSENEENTEEFVPMTLYTQVRRSGNEEHLPSDSEDAEGGRLKEVIKDSKIHTVYTEEGYEDSAYDHAGHEKEAEDSEGYSEYNKEEELKKEPRKIESNRESDDGDQVNEGSLKIFKTAKIPRKTPTDYQNVKLKKIPPKIKNRLVRTKQIKTMKLKNNSDGTQMQITSEVKMTLNPDHGSSTEIIEVMPKIVEYFNEESPKNEAEINLFPKVLLRKRRYTNDFPKIDVKEDFIKGIVHSDIPEYRKEIQQDKYPYYNVRYLNENSPLRYAENLQHIPLKFEGEMSFYEQADKIQCAEVSDDIDAIPKRIQEVEEAINNGEKLEHNGSGKSPRLGKLGRRINCLKRKYFGDDPLDSPLFKEKTIGRVSPLFKIFEEKQAGFQSHYSKPNQTPRPSDNVGGSGEKKYHSKFSIQEIQNKISENSVLSDNNYDPSVVDGSTDSFSYNKYSSPNTDTQTSTETIVNQMKPDQEISPNVEIINVNNFGSINQITTDTPRSILKSSQSYLTDAKPHHIYDQIELLELPPTQIVEMPVISKVENEREAKLVEEASNQSYQAAELRMNFNRKHYHPFLNFRQKNWYRRPQQNFDINAYLLNQYGKTENNKKNIYNTNSISHHNQQIVPLEQLNVFSDVLNNIKNGTNDPIKAGIMSYSNQMKNFYKPVAKMKIPPKKIHIQTSDLTKYLNNRNAFHMKSSTSTTTSSPTEKPKRGDTRYKTTTEEEFYEDEYRDVSNDQIFGKKTISGKKSTSSLPDEEEEHIDSEVSESNTKDTINTETVGRTTEILGLVPPSTWQYRTIYQPLDEFISDSKISGSENLNKYHVLGMKPPSKIHEVYDFQKRITGKGTSRFQNLKLRRGKRNANRKSYFEVVRNQKPDTTETITEADEDDYVPHRPKNWHWDETLKKIVYDKPKVEDYNTDDDDSDEEEVEVEDSIPKIIEQTSTRRSFTTTTPINGLSYVDFIKILKSNENYVSIPDPTTTKEGIKTETTSVSTTTGTSASTKPPEFLNILSKLRRSDSYVLIKDKNSTKVTTTTEVSAEENEENIDDSETALSNMQNSPGRGAVDIGHNLKIFDVNDFLPRVKTYSPRTTIDYSKYKTIRRIPSKRPPTESPEERTSEKVETSIAPISSSLHQVAEPSTEGKLKIIEVSRGGYSTTDAAILPTLPITNIILRTRGRRPIATSTSSPVSTANISKDDVVISTASKSKRVYPRRRLPHIRLRTTTERQADELNSNNSARNARHNHDESSGGETKIISLETLIKMDQLNHIGNNNSSLNITESSTNKNELGKLETSQNISVDDILKNINQLKEVHFEGTIPDYGDDTSTSLVQDELTTQASENDKEYFDDDTRIELSAENTTDRKLVISKDKEQGMYNYVSVR